MENEEIRSTLEQIKAQVKAKPENKDKTEDEIDGMILDSFYKAYTEGKMTKEDLGGLAEAMGYEFTEDFEQDPAAAPEVNPEQNAAPAEGAEGMSEGNLEAVRTMEPGQSAEEFQEKVEDVKEGENVPPESGEGHSEEKEEVKTEEGEEEEESEDDERKKASELWKMNLNK